MVGREFRRKSVIIRTRFEGFHKWPSAPDEVAFLRALHRHEFHVTLRISVFHEDREVEFLLVKNALEAWIGLEQPFADTDSCEVMAEKIIEWARSKYEVAVPAPRAYECEVSEDGENGAVVEKWTHGIL